MGTFFVAQYPYNAWYVPVAFFWLKVQETKRLAHAEPIIETFGPSMGHRPRGKRTKTKHSHTRTVWKEVERQVKRDASAQSGDAGNTAAATDERASGGGSGTGGASSNDDPNTGTGGGQWRGV